MHILGLIMAVAVGIAVWWWRLKMLSEAGNEAIDQIQKARGHWRRRQFRKKAESSVLAGVENPALAAAIFLVALSEEEPVYQEQANTIINDFLGEVMPAEQAKEDFIFAQWAGKAVIDAKEPLRRFRKLWQTTLAYEEKQQFIAMAEQISHLGKQSNPSQRQAISKLKEALSDA